MQEMVSAEQNVQRPKFGNLVIIKTKEAFLDAIDREHKDTTIIIHLYTPFTAGCDTMNACFNTLAEVRKERFRRLLEFRLAPQHAVLDRNIETNLVRVRIINYCIFRSRLIHCINSV